MSRGKLAYARPEPLAPPSQRPRHIEIVTTREQKRARPKLAYAVVTVAALFAIFTAQLLLSIVVSDGAYQMAALQDQQKELLRTQDALTEQLNVLDSTQNLSAQAANLGMVPNAYPYALDLGTGSTYALPGSADPAGCGGACNLITNTQLAGVALVDPSAPATTAPAAGHAGGATGAPQGTTQTEQAPVTSIPAPVTH